MIMLLPRGRWLHGITAHILGYSAASIGKTKRPQPKEAASESFSSPLLANDSWDLAFGKAEAVQERRMCPPHTQTHTQGCLHKDVILLLSLVCIIANLTSGLHVCSYMPNRNDWAGSHAFKNWRWNDCDIKSLNIYIKWLNIYNRMMIPVSI